jgi:hypothetical protein
MTFHARSTSALPAIAILLWLAPASIASAQDVMELDLAFKNSLSQKPSPELREERREGQVRRYRARDAQGLVAETKRRARKHRGQRR